MSSPRVENATDFVVEPHLLVGKDHEHLVAIVKATFEYVPGAPRRDDGTFTVAPPARRRPVRAADVPWGDPTISSVRYPSDLCVEKPGTDVIGVCRAYAPDGKPVPRFDAGLRVGPVQRVVRVTGPRVWLPDGDGLTEPGPVGWLDVRYDHAFGGRDTKRLDAPPAELPENPVGRGIAQSPGSLSARPGPQLEDPSAPIRNAADRPKPVGLGVIGRHWAPRRSLWGTYDAAWLEGRAPLLPADFDPRANQAASPGLVATPQLVGGEEGALTHLVAPGAAPPSGTVPFVLPRIPLVVAFHPKGGSLVRFTPRIDTLLIDTLPMGRISGPPPPFTIELVWRAQIKAPRRPGDVTLHVREERA